tara:strand:- start:28 stop:495 length:468 start_codon:yes stop_codon:yes gene_type:complete
MIEDSREVPHFGTCYLFSVTCKSCKYHKADIEAKEEKSPCKLEFETEKKEDLNTMIVKSAQAKVKIPTLRMSVGPNVASNGYITTIEGLLNRFKKIIEQERDNSDDPKIRKKAKNLLKKLWKIECGDEKVKIVIEDKTGNSTIVSDKVKVTKLRK